MSCPTLHQQGKHELLRFKYRECDFQTPKRVFPIVIREIYFKKITPIIIEVTLIPNLQIKDNKHFKSIHSRRKYFCSLCSYIVIEQIRGMGIRDQGINLQHRLDSLRTACQ